MNQQPTNTSLPSPNMPGRVPEDLVAVGEVDGACRFAGRACVMLRHDDPQAEQRFNVLLHRLTPRLSW